MQRLLRPTVLIPLILGLALVAALLSFSDARKVLHLMRGFQHLYLLYYLLLMILYEVVRGVQWHFLLDALSLRLPWRSQIFAFALGEISKILPGGNYFQNYVLQQEEGADFGRTASATLLIAFVEVGVSLVGVVVLGVGDWSGWLRPLILIGVPIAALLALAFHRYFHLAAPPWLIAHVSVQGAMHELRELRAGARDLLHVRVLAGQTALGAAYLVIAGTALYVTAHGIGQTGISYADALSIWFLTQAMAQILPIPIDIGVVEVSGVGALLAIGVEKNAAIGIMLVNRVLSLGAALTIALIVTIVLREQFAVLRAHRLQGGA